METEEENRFSIPAVCSGCSCKESCTDPEKCECMQLTAEGIQGMAKVDRPTQGDHGYTNRRLTRVILTGIYECNSNCHCSKTRCPNRVVQLPISIPLQLFRTKSKGWGVRTTVDIPAGQFICIYAGAILSDDVAEHLGGTQGDEYFADMDLVNVIEKIKFGDPPEEDEDKP